MNREAQTGRGTNIFRRIKNNLEGLIISSIGIMWVLMYFYLEYIDEGSIASLINHLFDPSLSFMHYLILLNIPFYITLGILIQREKNLRNNLELKVKERTRRLDESLKDTNNFGKRLHALHDHATSLAFTTNLDEVERVTHSTLIDLLGIDRGSFGIVVENVLHQKYVWKMDAPPTVRMPLSGPGITVRAVNSGSTQVIDDVSSDPDYVSAFGDGKLTTCSELAVPVKVGDEVVAVINLESTKPCAFNEDDQKLVETFAEHVASAMSRMSKVKALEVALRRKEWAEKNLLDTNNRLNELVEEKTRELVDAEKIVVAGKIASMLGHDLRAPIRIISSAAELIKTDPDKSDKWIDMIKRSAKEADKMIDTFRESVRDSSIELGLVNFCDLLNKSIEEASINESITLDFECSSGLDAVVLDGFKIKRVIDNMISNAIEAMPNGGLFRISAEVKGENIVLAVSDSGVGIVNEEISNLFKPFYTTKQGGMGLGLAFCKRVVDAHDGSITVKSKENEGTTFTILLPYKIESHSQVDMQVFDEDEHVILDPLGMF